MIVNRASGRVANKLRELSVVGLVRQETSSRPKFRLKYKLTVATTMIAEPKTFSSLVAPKSSGIINKKQCQKD